MCSCALLISGMSKSGRRLLGALKKVGSSSRSLERLNVYDWPTPPSSHEEAPVEPHEEEGLRRRVAPQGEVPDDSHLDIRGDRETQASTC